MKKKIDTTRKRESEGGCSVRSSSSSTLRKNKRTAKKGRKKHALYPRQYIHHFIICLKQCENMCMFHQLVSRKLFFALL